MYHRVLVPVDDSETSKAALAQVAQFCCEQHAIARIVHVIDLAQFSWGGAEFIDVGELQSSLKENGHKVLAGAQAILAAQNINCETALIEIWGGSLANAINDAAKTWQADIIVMGSHGWTGLDHLLLGSVAEGVLRHTSVPVLLFPIQRKNE